MLVLTRGEMESIIIGRELIKIKILKISGRTVKLGIEAPPEFSVHRDEIYAQINSEFKQSLPNPHTINHPDPMLANS